MAILECDKAVEFLRYAEHCMKMVTAIPKQEDRIILREMAAEWVKLAHVMAETVSQGAGGQRGRNTSRA